MAWVPRTVSTLCSRGCPAVKLKKGRSFPAAMLAGALESFLPSRYEVDFVQKLEVFHHESGQAVGLPPTACPGAGAVPGLEHVPTHCCLQPVLTQ